MKKCFLFLTALLSFGLAKAQTVDVLDFAEGFNQPVGIETAPGVDNRLFIVERPGLIHMLTLSGQKINAPFLNIQDLVLDTFLEQGLLGLAFDPGYEDNGYFYVSYNNLSGDMQVSRFQVNMHNRTKAKKNTEKLIITWDKPFPNHNGGAIHFGPDGYLYISTGDGGSAGDPFNNAQNISKLQGKILRIDVHSGDPYAIPADNPFVGMAGARPEIWDLGLRNPWRFTFDRLTGDMWIGDVGQDMWEELNYEPAGEGGNNYGWRCYEGTHPYTECSPTVLPLVMPVHEYAHSEDTSLPCSGTIVNGYVYRGTQSEWMYGKNFHADFCTGQIHAFWFENGAPMHAVVYLGEPFEYTSWGEDQAGELYLADMMDGEIYRVVDGSADRKDVSQFDAANTLILYPNPNNGQFNLVWSATADGDCELIVTNVLGQSVSVQTIPTSKGRNTHAIDVAELSSGTYFVTIRSASESATTRFVIK
jgi:glucose/arabinose dehydrogenase